MNNFKAEDFVFFWDTGERMKVTYTSSTSMRFSWEKGWEIQHNNGPWEPYAPEDDDAGSKD